MVDRLTKSTNFIPVKSNWAAEYLAKLYIDNIVCYYGIPKEIVYNRNPLFTSHSCKAFQQPLGTEIKLSTAYHPHTDDQSKRTIQTLEDFLRSYTLGWG